MEKKITVDELRSIVYNVHFYDEDDNDLLKQHRGRRIIFNALRR